MPTLDFTLPRDRVRLAVADTDDIPILPDAVYDYYLTKNNNNENRSVRDAAYAILGVLSRNTHERLDRIEFYGDLVFEQYLKFINAIIKDPRTALSVAGGYCGGLSKADMEANEENLDTVLVPDPPQAKANIPLYF